MTNDPYKAMTIAYNHLNLPRLFTWTGGSFNGNSVEILYNAAGTKLRKTVKTGATVNYTQDYIGGIEYRDNVREAIYTAEGRVFYTSPTTTRYEYNIKDHLGNTRLTFSDKSGNGTIEVTNTASNEILQENHYYPFGLNHEGPWMNDAARDNKYQYNGKEWNDDFGLNWYNYGKRWYDQAIGRFPTVDPIASDFAFVTPYNYAENEPVANIDLWGLQKVSSSILNKASNTLKGVNEGLQQRYGFEPVRGDTKFGIRDNEAGRISTRTGKPVGEWLIRADQPHKGANYEHINVNPNLTGQKDPHTPIPGGSKTLNALESTGKTLDAVGKIAKPAAIAIDAVRIADAIHEDGGQIGDKTIETSASVAGGWAGAFAGAAVGSKAGSFIGGGIGAFFFGAGAVPGAGIGGFIGGLVGGVAGAMGGSAAAESAAKQITQPEEKK